MSIVVLALTFALSSQAKQQSVEVDVLSSRAQTACEDGIQGNTNCREKLHIVALAGQERLLLVSDSKWRRWISNDLLPLGRYQLRLLKEENPKPYMLHRRYELQYQDGRTEEFELEGIEVK